MFPVPALALAEPLDGVGDALLARLVAFGFRDPLEIFAAAARREAVERGFGLRRFVEGSRELGMQRRRRLGPIFWLARGRSVRRKLGGLGDELVEIWRQVVDAGELAELPHG